MVGKILTGLTSLLYALSLGVMMPRTEVERVRPEFVFTQRLRRRILGSTRAGIGINLLLSIAGECLSEARGHANDHKM